MITKKHQGFALITVLIYSLLSSLAIVTILQTSLHQSKQLSAFSEVRLVLQHLEQDLIRQENQLLTTPIDKLDDYKDRLLESKQCVIFQQQFWQVNYYQLQATGHTDYVIKSTLARPVKLLEYCDAPLFSLMKAGRQTYQITTL